MKESNLDGDCIATMEEINLINDRLSCTDICGQSHSKLVNVDGSVSLVHSPVTDNVYIPQKSDGDN